MENVVRINAPEASQWQSVTESFLLFKRVSGLSPRTLRDYETYLSAFFRQHPEALDPKESRLSVLSYLSGVMAPATYNIRRAYIRSFWNWLISEGIATRNPINGLPSRKAQPRIVKTNVEDIKTLLDSLPKDTWNGLRDAALLLLQMDTGIRPGEALSLLASDVSVQGRTVNVRAAIAKTRTSRVLPISDATAAAIDKLLRVRPEEWKASSLFCTSSGTPLSVRGWYHRLEAACKKVGVPKVSPYDLRHGFALLYLKAGGDAFSLKDIMGHSTMTMTSRYVAFSGDDIQEAHARFSPMNVLCPKPVKRMGKIR
jgi:site-specific recombinase XerD